MEPVLARATIHLPGLPAGTEALVDPSSPYIRDCLKRKFLLKVKQPPADKSAKTLP